MVVEDVRAAGDRRRCARSRRRESVREVVSQRLARLDPTTGELLELAAVAGPGVRARRAAARRAGRARAARRARARDAQRDDRGAPVADARLPLHPRARAPRAVRPPERRAPRRAAPADRRGARGDRPAGAGPHARRPRPPLRRGRADRRPARARSTTTCSPRTPHRPRSPTARPRRGCARRCGSASTTSTAAPRSCSRSAPRAISRGPHGRGARGVRPGGGDRAAVLGDGELLARAAIGFEKTCWRPGLTDQGARELLDEASAAVRPRGLDAARRRARRARARARVPGRAAGRAGGPRAGRRDGPARRRPRAVSRAC